MDKRNVLTVDQDRGKFDRVFSEYSDRIVSPDYEEFWRSVQDQMSFFLKQTKDLHKPTLIRSPTDVMNIFQKLDVLGPRYVLNKTIRRLGKIIGR